MCHDFSDLRDGSQLLDGCLLYPLKGAKALSEVAGGLSANIRDADGKEEGVKRTCLALLQGLNELDGFFAGLPVFTGKALQVHELLRCQPIQVCGITYTESIIEYTGSFFGEAVDIHGVTAGKVSQTRHSLRLAGGTVQAEEMGAPLNKG